MKKSLILIAAGVAGVGLAIPAFAAPSNSRNSPDDSTSSSVATTASVFSDDGTVPHTSTPSSVPATTATPVSTAPASTATPASLPGTSVASLPTSNTVEDNPARQADDDRQTTSTVNDVSGPCDEAEHAADPRCTGAAQTSTDDNSNRGPGRDDSGDDRGDDHGRRHGGHGSDD